ncbi:2TM domain-containing protein [Flavobacteriaceae bacterium]|nr:2TM domain-containing protein [Flavobacteriaceae bacterium]
MEIKYNKELQYLNAQKKVKEIKGFYSHLTVMFFLLPFLVFINLKLSPGYHWFWWAILGHVLGLFFHWLKVLGLSSIGFGKDWEQKKIEEYMRKNK